MDESLRTLERQAQGDLTLLEKLEHRFLRVNDIDNAARIFGKRFEILRTSFAPNFKFNLVELKKMIIGPGQRSYSGVTAYFGWTAGEGPVLPPYVYNRKPKKEKRTIEVALVVPWEANLTIGIQTPILNRAFSESLVLYSYTMQPRTYQVALHDAWNELRFSNCFPRQGYHPAVYSWNPSRRQRDQLMVWARKKIPDRITGLARVVQAWARS